MKFKSGDTVKFNSPGYGANSLYTVICEHSPQRHHYLVCHMNSGKLISMCEAGDLRLATEEEC